MNLFLLASRMAADASGAEAACSWADSGAWGPVHGALLAFLFGALLVLLQQSLQWRHDRKVARRQLLQQKLEECMEILLQAELLVNQFTRAFKESKLLDTDQPDRFAQLDARLRIYAPHLVERVDPIREAAAAHLAYVLDHQKYAEGKYGHRGEVQAEFELAKVFKDRVCGLTEELRLEVVKNVE